MGSFRLEGLRMPRQDDRMGVQTQLVIRPGETLEEPTAEKARAARDENALTSQLVP